MSGAFKAKIINDPVYGFLRFPDRQVMDIIEHPWFQRLRNIKQMGMAHLVYPGAVHTRFHHSLGACHLMSKALEELKVKGVELTDHECVAAQLAILLHDIGHGPFSHALEYSLVTGINHEQLSAMIIQRLAGQQDGIFKTVSSIFNHTYPKRFLHQLVSSQLDVDRMDYLNRDSFYTGVSEGVIGYDRILQMLTVQRGELMVEEKGIHSVEKFIIARRLMYWQVYLHKTVLGAEMLLIQILRRARALADAGAALFASPPLKHFLYRNVTFQDFENEPEHLEQFCQLDDSDLLNAMKVWEQAEDPVLARLCGMLNQRRLFKVKLSSKPMDGEYEELRAQVRARYGFDEDTLDYFVFRGQATNSTYNNRGERICIAMKNGTVLDISEVEDAIVNQTLAVPVLKNYICHIPL